MRIFLAVRQDNGAADIIRGLLDVTEHRIVGVAHDGTTALAAIEAKQPDVVLADMVLPLQDGAQLAREVALHNDPLRPQVVLRAPFGINRILSPTESAVVVETWQQAVAQIERASGRPLAERIVRMVRETLIYLGFSMNKRGTLFITDAVLLCIGDESRLNNLRDRIYAVVAEQRQTSIAAVERSVRYAIENAFNHGDLHNLEDVFGYTVTPDRGKPTNRQFFAQLAQNILRHCE